MSHRRGTCQRLLWIVLGLTVLAGCGAPPAGPSGTTDDAGKQLSAALDAWKAGKKPADLQNVKPVVHVADQDWQTGKLLKSYQLSDAPTKNGGSWRVAAVLTLSAEGKPEQQKNVLYEVTLQPAITILRSDEGGE